MKAGNTLTRIAALLLTACAGGALAAEATPLQQRIAHGEYLSRVGDCTACHTGPGGQPYAGGLKMETPVGAIYSTNITPDRKNGIGNYSFADFSDAVRKGVAKDGRRLYPAMPYPSFVKVSDDDLQDLYLYFMHGVKPAAQENRESDIPWPLSMRWPLFMWDLVFRHDGTYQPDAQQSAEWNRGAYLVQGLGHCGTCHTPRGIGFQEQALDQQDKEYLTGGTLEGWHAADLTGNPLTGLGNWSERDITRFLKTGHTEHSAAFGSMTDVIQDSTQHLNDADLRAIAVYLKSLKPAGDGAKQPAAYDAGTQAALIKGDVSRPGAQLYLDNCAACHRTDGKGYVNTFPALAQNPVLLSDDPSSLISIVLRGGKMPVTAGAPTGLTMPDFAWRLSDDDVAQLLSFVRSSWGNQASAVKPAQVSDIRETIAPEKRDK